MCLGIVGGIPFRALGESWHSRLETWPGTLGFINAVNLLKVGLQVLVLAAAICALLALQACRNQKI